MAATRIVEEERGTFTGTPRNPHQGYYAGDFTTRSTELDGFARALRYSELPPTTAASRGWF
jgi:hypothetical protein